MERRMSAHRVETRPVPISGHVMHLGGGDRVVFHLRDRMPWVAEFRGGRVDLIDAATWWRQVPEELRSHAGRAAALARLAPLPSEVQQQIERLHQANDATALARSGLSPWAMFKRWFEAAMRQVRGWRARSLGSF
jgi:hypothetical protein